MSHDLVKAPLLEAAKDVANFFLTPLRWSKNIGINTTDTMFKIMGSNIEDNNDNSKIESDENRSVYDLAKPNLELSAIIYYYTELLSETKNRVADLAKDNYLSTSSNTKNPSDVELLKNAFNFVKEKSKIIKSCTVESTTTSVALAEYKESLEQLENLRKKLNIGSGTLDVFKTYFEILSVPKKMTQVKSDLVLYNDFISLEFRLAFGGTGFNLHQVTNEVDHHENSYMHIIDHEHTSTSLPNPDGFIDGFEAEIVWAIIVCEKVKNITVIFRGSVNAMDWIKNTQVNMTDFVLPGFVTNNQKPGRSYGRVHEGFYKYLFGPTSRGTNGSIKSKAEEIIGILKGDFFDKKKYKDYNLFVTGHSLGGSLSTLFATRAAALNEFDNMVTNVSFASPFVGNQEFRNEFYSLEMNKKIRHLRITNSQDCVPLIPCCTLPVPEFDTYKHVGMNIRLYADDLFSPTYRRFYPKIGSVNIALRNTINNNIVIGLSVGIIGKHLCPEYTKRLTNSKMEKDLKKITLDELYGNQDITGWSYVTC